MKPFVNIFWYRRDLRLHDNAGLYHALNSSLPVLPIFIFDKNILDELEDKYDKRVSFIHSSLQNIQKELIPLNSSLKVFYSTPIEAFKEILSEYNVSKVFTNNDYEQYAIDRDNLISQFLKEKGISFHSFKDQVIFEKNEILKDDGKPYTVFTPYSKKWKSSHSKSPITSYPNEDYFSNLYKHTSQLIPSINDIGFEEIDEIFPSTKVDDGLIKKYSQQRDYPAVNGTSKLSVHLRFGTISIRELVKKAIQLNETFLNELLWREFYQMILWHFPHISLGYSFKKEYDLIEWRNNEDEFKKWCEGKTGYPIVDAGMRELNSTGYMHNRVRMIVASFLTKHLLIDWRWGEAYFAKKLLDYDFAANNGGWQWAAGSGCDAAPYFRVFNPTLQTEKFDKDLKYIRKWIPELETFNYPKPIVNHDEARKRCLEIYSIALKK